MIDKLYAMVCLTMSGNMSVLAKWYIFIFGCMDEVFIIISVWNEEREKSEENVDDEV